jgi:KUP system potassium uptake protein
MYLGYCPRLLVRHTSRSERGQIYIPHINWALMIACIALVLGFRSSSALGAAYGIAVTLTMILTTILFAAVTHKVWRWPLWVSLLFGGFFLLIELAFFYANVFKIPNGGWFALVTAGIIFLLMTTWKAGRKALYTSIKPSLLPIGPFIEGLEKANQHRVKGCAIFLTGTADATPLALLHNLRHNKVLHETVVLINVVSELRAYLEPEEESIQVRDLGFGFHSVTARFGYMETPNVPFVVSLLPDYGVPFRSNDITYFLSRERIVPAKSPKLAPLRRAIFSVLARNSTSAADFFCLPPGRVVELGVQIEC